MADKRPQKASNKVLYESVSSADATVANAQFEKRIRRPELNT
jgi:hypothetical protein